MDSALNVTVQDGGVCVIRVTRPPMNVLDNALRRQLENAAEEASTRKDVRAVVLWGGEKVFSAGVEIEELCSMTHADMLEHSRSLQGAFTAIANIPKPVIAAVDGYALGAGLELALCADVRFAADDAILGQPEILLGLIPGAGGSQRLPRLIGPARAKDLLFTGRRIEATEALQSGLVNQVHSPEKVYQAAFAWAANLASGPSFALRAAKEAVDQGLEHHLDAALALERSLFTGLFATHDREAGIASYLEQGPGKASFDGATTNGELV
jgi:cyclohexa-1,5-dienecarbonyl-CoA hydratase